MFLSNWRLLFRRWYVVILGLLATGVLCFLAVQVVPVKYQATSAVVLLPPETATTQQGGNPYLALGGLDTVSGVVAKAMADRNVRIGIRAAGGTGSYTLEPDLAAGGPVLLITAEDVTPGGALATLDVIAKQLPRTLSSLQTTSGVRPSSLIRSKPITRDDVAVPVRKSQIRALFAAAAAGLAGTVLLASVLDGYLGRRSDERRRRRERALRLAGADDADEIGAAPADEPRELTAAERDRVINGMTGARGPDGRGPAGDRELPSRSGSDRDVPGWPARVHNLSPLNGSAGTGSIRGPRPPVDDPALDEPTEIAPLDRDRLLRGMADPGTPRLSRPSANGFAAPNGSGSDGAQAGFDGSAPNRTGTNGSVANGSGPNGSNGSARTGSVPTGYGRRHVAGAPASNGNGNGQARYVSDPDPDPDGVDEPTEISRRPDLRPVTPPAVEQDTVDFRRLAAELREARADGRFLEPE